MIRDDDEEDEDADEDDDDDGGRRRDDDDDDEDGAERIISFASRDGRETDERQTTRANEYW